MRDRDRNPESMFDNEERPLPNNVISTQTLDILKPFPLRLIAAGCFTLLIFLASFLTWISLAPIEGAVVSPGIFSVSSHRKVIQHLEGGIVEKIFVQDGYRVKEGQLLIQLNNIQQTSVLRNLERQLFEAKAVMARLQAELSDKKEIEFPEEIAMRNEKDSVDSITTGQRNILASLRALNSDKRAVLQNKIAQAEEEIKGITC